MVAKELVSNVRHLAPASRTAIKLIGLLNQSANSNEEIVQVLKFDTVLTAKLLRACNSPFYGLREPVASVDQAVLILGYDEIFRLVVAFSFSSTMTRSLPGYEAVANELWHHSLVTGLICETLVKDDSPVNVEPAIAFTAGMLHDIGKLALNEALAKNYLIAIRARLEDKSVSSAQAEQDVLGTDHAEVGALLLQTWGLPDLIIEAVQYHHRPVHQPRPRLSALVHVADQLAYLIKSPFEWDAFAARVASDVAKSLELTPEKIKDFAAASPRLLEQAKHLGSQT